MQFFAFASNFRPLFYVEAGDLAAARKAADMLALEGEQMRAVDSWEEQEMLARESYERDRLAELEEHYG
jgi:hypothetical protein